MPRTKRIIFTANETEEQKVKRLAASEGMTVSTWLRRQIMIAPEPKQTQQQAA